MRQVDQVVYQLWTGTNNMSENRKKCLESSKNLGVPVKLITPDNLDEIIVQGNPLHKSYKYLIPEHRADYLRSYIMHFHGGCYADIKYYEPNNNYAEMLELINKRPEVDIIGVPERTVAFHSYERKDVFSRIISSGYLIARPDTEFTKLWYTTYVDFLNAYSRQLEMYGQRKIAYPIPYINGMAPFHYTCEVLTRTSPGSILNCLKPERRYDIPYK